jgi:hypothetical protein
LVDACSNGPRVYYCLMDPAGALWVHQTIAETQSEAWTHAMEVWRAGALRGVPQASERMRASGSRDSLRVRMKQMGYRVVVVRVVVVGGVKV